MALAIPIDPPFLPRYRRWMLAETTPGGRDYLKWAPPAGLGAVGADNHYDPVLVYLEVMEFTDDPSWWEVVEVARYQWLLYVSKNAGAVMSYHKVTAGFRRYYERTGDETCRALVCRQSSTVSNVTPASTWYPKWNLSRDTAYGLMAVLDGEACGMAPNDARRLLLRDWAIGHVRQWFDPAATFPVGTFDADTTGPECMAVQPFMVGLTMRALIQHWDIHRDAESAAAVKMALDGLWDTCWCLTRIKQADGKLGPPVKDPAVQAFPYWDRETYALSRKCPNLGWDAFNSQPQAAPAMNNLIGPAYAWWAATQAGDDAEREEYLRRHDAIFAGQSQPGHQKEYNQFVCWSVQGLRWRKQALEPAARATGYSLVPSSTGGRANEPSRPFTVRLNGAVDAPVAVVPTRTLFGGKFRPGAVVLTTDQPVGCFHYIPAEAAAGQAAEIGVANAAGLIAPAPARYEVGGITPEATGVRLVAPKPTASGWQPFRVETDPPGSTLPRRFDARGGVVHLKPYPIKPDTAWDATALQSDRPFVWLAHGIPGEFAQWKPNGRTQPWTVEVRPPDGSVPPEFAASIVFDPVAEPPPPPTATTFTLTGPASASVTVGEPATFTVAPVGGPYTGKVIPGFSGIHGTLVPPELAYSGSTAPQTFAYTPSDVGTTRVLISSVPPLPAPPAATLTVLPRLATTYTLTGPKSVEVGQVATFTVAPVGGVYTGEITPTADGVGGPPLVFAASAEPQRFSFRFAAVGEATITTTSSPPLTDPTPWTLEVLRTPATTLTLTGPASGEMGEPSEWFAVTLDGRAIGRLTVTPSDGGAGGEFRPASLVWMDGEWHAQHFVYVPKTPGEVTITMDSDPKLATPPPHSFAALVKGLNGSQRDQGRLALRAVAYTIHGFAQPNVGLIDQTTRDVLITQLGEMAGELAGGTRSGGEIDLLGEGTP